jgi:hypothetical protein
MIELKGIKVGTLWRWLVGWVVVVLYSEVESGAGGQMAGIETTFACAHALMWLVTVGAVCHIMRKYVRQSLYYLLPVTNTLTRSGPGGWGIGIGERFHTRIETGSDNTGNGN